MTLDTRDADARFARLERIDSASRAACCRASPTAWPACTGATRTHWGRGRSKQFGRLTYEIWRAARPGSGFDLRAFHDAVLALGSVPLRLLKEQLDAGIARLLAS
jgi:hypothetical protein